ncbi:MAG: helix-turn-helix domain-containing protein [Gemmatimonadaceae bacterium]|jgi:Cu(I)-responsive transcriptional regulator|nr:helix-turn-helix domain-containing protein [Gemmatimonadaceae bacterium]
MAAPTIPPPDGAEFSIGALATRTGTTAETIRYYERIGLLPAPARAGSGRYRRYDATDVDRLAFIRRARELGFSIEEVGELLGLAGDPHRPCADVDRLARAHLATVDEKLRQLSTLRDELQRVIGQCAGATQMVDCRILGALRAQGDRYRGTLTAQTEARADAERDR